MYSLSTSTFHRQMLFYIGQPLKYLQEMEQRNYDIYNMKRITVVPYTLYGCFIYIDHTAVYLMVPMIKTSKSSLSSFASLITTFVTSFVVAQSTIKVKLPLFYCYDLLLMNVENIMWFGEKWVLIHPHFSRDGQQGKSKSPKRIFFDTQLTILIFLSLYI